jgi:hypothetical protein
LNNTTKKSTCKEFSIKKIIHYGAIYIVFAVKSVNFPVFATVAPIAGGLDKFKVPPSVKLPEVVTVPVRVSPLTVPVPPTLVTVPVLDVLLLKVVQSVADK